MLKVAMLEREFHTTRIKIALIFFVIIFAIGLVINTSHFVIERSILEAFTDFRLHNIQKLKPNNQNNINNPNFQPIDITQLENDLKNKIDDQQDRTLLYSLILQLLLSLLGALISYYASGFILQPIKENIENQKKFLKFASHELKTPISTISLLSESESNNPKMASISEEAEKLDNLTRKYLELLTTEHRNELKEINLKSLVENITKDFKNRVLELNLNIENKIPESLNITTNEISLHAILRNMIENATKYNRNQGTIVFQTKQNSSLEIIVENTLGNLTTQNGYGVGTEIIKYHCNLRNWKFETLKENSNFISKLSL